jgi:hypothetical protein
MDAPQGATGEPPGAAVPDRAGPAESVEPAGPGAEPGAALRTGEQHAAYTASYGLGMLVAGRDVTGVAAWGAVAIAVAMLAADTVQRWRR